MTATTTVSAPLFERLRQVVAGPVLVPGDDAYGAAVRGHNLAVQHRPSVAVVALDADDVAAAVRLAAEARTPVSVLATGHGSTAPIEGGLTIVTTRLTDVVVDQRARTVRVGAGVSAGALVAAVEAEGFTLPMGSATSVGVVGYTLGGGLGPLGRAYGWASDRLLEVELVVPSGDLRRVTAADADLFWALSGGKQGFGVVTALTFALSPLPSVVGRRAVVDGSAAIELLRRWVALDESPATTSSVRVMKLPDLDVVPEPLRGRHVVEVTSTTAGDDDSAGDVAWSALLAELPVLVQQRTVGGLTDWYATLGDPAGAMPTWQAGRLLSRFDADGVEALAAATHPDRRLPLLAVEVRRLGGRLADDRPDAVGGRDAAYLLNVVGAPVPELFAVVVPAAFADLEQRLQPWLHGGTQANFHGPVTDDNPGSRAWPTATADRLAEGRRALDPAGLFR